MPALVRDHQGEGVQIPIAGRTGKAYSLISVRQKQKTAWDFFRDFLYSWLLTSYRYLHDVSSFSPVRFMFWDQQSCIGLALAQYWWVSFFPLGRKLRSCWSNLNRGFKNLGSCHLRCPRTMRKAQKRGCLARTFSCWTKYSSMTPSECIFGRVSQNCIASSRPSRAGFFSDV